MPDGPLADDVKPHRDSTLPPFSVVDLSQPLSPEMAGWRGTERAVIEISEVPIDHGVPGGSISATHISMVAHAGTHVDAARHFFPDGLAIDQYPIERFACRGVAIDVARVGAQPLTAAELAELDPGIGAGDAVLLHFGYADRYASQQYYDHPFLAADAADYLVERGVNIVGVDTITPDCPAEMRPPRFDYPVHTRLLGNDVLIIENLGPGVKEVVGRWFTLAVGPFRISGADASPVVPLALLHGCEEA